MGRAWLGSISPHQPQAVAKRPELCHLHGQWADSGLSLRLSLNPNDKDKTKMQKFTECHG